MTGDMNDDSVIEEYNKEIDNLMTYFGDTYGEELSNELIKQFESKGILSSVGDAISYFINDLISDKITNVLGDNLKIVKEES